MIKKIQEVLHSVWQRAQGQPKKLLQWYVFGMRDTPPPDFFKKQLVKKIGRQRGIKVFVETGTYKGDMTAAAAHVFDAVYSIELHQPFYEKAVARFSSDPKVHIIQGNSAQALPHLVAGITQPCLFWLDAHGGKSSRTTDGNEAAAPVRPELEAILHHPLAQEHVILIDDVHTFIRGTKWGVGVWSEIEAVRTWWLAKHPDWVWKVKNNVLHIYKKRNDAI